MKKMIKFKNKNGVIKVSKKSKLSKKEMKKINILLKENVSIMSLKNIFSENIIKENKNSLMIKFIKFKLLVEKLDMFSSYNPLIHIDPSDMTKHMVAIGCTGIGKTVLLERLLEEEPCIDFKTLNDRANNAKEIILIGDQDQEGHPYLTMDLKVHGESGRGKSFLFENIFESKK